MQTIKTRMVGADTRVYYLDNVKDDGGRPYLVITEIPTKREKKGKKRRHRIYIHPKTAERFRAEINAALDDLLNVK